MFDLYDIIVPKSVSRVKFKKKIKKINNCDTSDIEEKIGSYFADLHGRLYLIERKLRQRLQNLTSKHSDLDPVSTNVTGNINLIRQLVLAWDNSHQKKYNLKSLLQKLKECEDIPCHLVSQSNKGEPFTFHVNDILKNLEDYFEVSNSLDKEYVLVSPAELPDGYESEMTDAATDSDTDSDISRLLTSSCSMGIKSPRSSETGSELNEVTLHDRPEKPKEIPKSKNCEEVIVTHIDTVDCFYVQKKRNQRKFSLFVNDILKNVKDAPPVTHTEINDLYFVIYRTKSASEWCRGRLLSINRNTCEVFLIDYGNTIVVTKDKLRIINSFCVRKPPFAIKCKLHNIANAEWHPDAHLHMAKIISGKSTFMFVKGHTGDTTEVKLMVSSNFGQMTAVDELLLMTCNEALAKQDHFSYSDTKKILMGPVISRTKLFKSSKTFQVNDTIDVIIIHICNPHEMFVQIKSYREDYLKMSNSLTKQFGKQNACLPFQGTYVAVEHKLVLHGNYHRAEVQNVDVLNQTAAVFLVDLGYKINVSWSVIKTLPENCARLECQAIQVKLADVQPFGDEWPKNLKLECIHRYIISETVLKMVVKNVSPLEVGLFEVHENVEICVNALLVTKNLAKTTGKLSQTVEWQRVEKKEEEDCGFMFLKQTKLNAIDSDNDDFDETDGIKQEVDVILAENPGMIYIKFHALKDKEQDLFKELQVYYTENKTCKSKWNIKDKCVTLDRKENEYCRGIIRGKVDDKYRVYLIDKVKEVIVSRENIFEADEYFSKRYPDTVFKCRLANIEPAGDKKKWSNMAIEYLQDIFKNHKGIFIRKVKIEGKSGSSPFPVEMWYSKLVVGTALEPSHTKFKSVNKLLVNQGLALKIKTTDLRKEIGDIIEHKTQVEDVEVTPNIDTTKLSCAESPNLSDKQKADGELNNVKGKEKVDWNDLITDEESESKECSTSEWLPPFKIAKKEFDAMITCADYDGSLFLHDINLEDLYRDMEKNLKKTFDSIDVKEDTVWVPDQLCTIHYDDNWYRGKVIDVKSPSDILVLMIDFGSDHHITPDMLSPKITYLDIPAFATRVKLHRVFPKDGTWSEYDYKTLLDTISERAKIVVKENISGELPEVEVFIESGECLNDLLVEKNSNLTRLLKTENEDIDDSIIEIIDSEETDVISTSVAKEIANTMIKTASSIASEGEESNTVEQSDEASEDSTITSNSGNSNVELLDTFKLAKIPAPDSSGKFKMTVINVINISQVVLDVLGDSEDFADDFLDISEDIRKSFDEQPLVEEITEGMACICPFSDDKCWYRARVHSVDDLALGYVLVFFVDYGNIDSVRYTDVRKMKPEWFRLPVRNQIACIDVKLNIPNNKDLALKHIGKVEGESKLIEVVSENPFLVHIYDNNNILSYQSLIDKGILSKN